MKLQAQLIEEIKRKNPLAEVMRDYGIEVEEDGGDRLKACCPFHLEDDTPSFKVYENDDHSKDNYHCYGCHAGEKGNTLKIYKGGDVVEITDAGSDVIAFVQNYEQVSFQEACKRLMARCGMPIPVENPAREKFLQSTTARNRSFWHVLQNNSDVLQYLYDRGLEDEDIAKWRLGMTGPNHPWKAVANRLVVGLIEDHYDMKQAKTLGMAYRTLNNEEPKYINDPTNEFYSKKHYIYGLNFAKHAIRKMGYAVVTEGYFDVILAHKHGMENTIATCGTSFTKEQMEMLRKLTDKLIFWYDGDSAGQKAMERALPDLLEMGFSVLFVDSDPFDPAEMIQKFGAEKTRQWLSKQAKPALQVIIDKVMDDTDTIINKAKTQALDRLMVTIQSCKRPSDRAVYKSYLAQRLQITL